MRSRTSITDMLTRYFRYQTDVYQLAGSTRDEAVENAREDVGRVAKANRIAVLTDDTTLTVYLDSK